MNMHYPKKIIIHRKVIKSVMAIKVEKTDVDAGHTRDTGANILQEQFAPGGRWSSLHNLCIKFAPSNSRYAPELKKKRLPRRLRFRYRLGIIIMPNNILQVMPST